MIVDAWLGNGSGVSAVEKLRRTGSVPHLFVSGDISRIGALRPGAVVIQKPFREAELARANSTRTRQCRRNLRGTPPAGGLRQQQQWAGTALHFWSGTGSPLMRNGGRISRLDGAAGPGRSSLSSHHVIDQSGMDT
jgi:DNA-binding response OmpR family regulator